VKFLEPRAAINGRMELDFSKLIARKRVWRASRIEPFCKINQCHFEPPIARQGMLTISDIGIGQTLNRQLFQGLPAPRKTKRLDCSTA
jgi:hypothetical protein